MDNDAVLRAIGAEPAELLLPSVVSVLPVPASLRWTWARAAERPVSGTEKTWISQ